MKKISKLLFAFTVAAAAAAGAVILFKKLGSCDCCNEDGECGCGCGEADKEETKEPDSSFDSREYVSIQPKTDKASSKEAEDNENDKDSNKSEAESSTAE